MRIGRKLTLSMLLLVVANVLLMGAILGAGADSHAEAHINVDSQIADYNADADAPAWRQSIAVGVLWVGFTLGNIGVWVGYHVLRHIPTPVLKVWFNVMPYALLGAAAYIPGRDIYREAKAQGVLG